MEIQWKGVMPAVTTKFSKEDTLNMSAFEVNIKAQMAAGVHGIILGGTLGEASTLTKDEKKILVEANICSNQHQRSQNVLLCSNSDNDNSPLFPKYTSNTCMKLYSNQEVMINDHC